MDVVSLKDQTVASLSGHIIEFKKGVVVSVPNDEILLKDLTAAGVQDAAAVDADVLSVLRGEKTVADADPKKGK